MSSSPWEWLSSGREDVARFNNAADLIDADYRVLASNARSRAMGPRNRVCNLPDLMVRLFFEGWLPRW